MQTIAAGSYIVDPPRRLGRPTRRAALQIATRTTSAVGITRLTKGLADVNLAGTRLSHYQVVDLIGAGGSGRVYRARDTRVPRCVAIKTLKSSASAARGLRTEAAALSRLAHPQIAHFYELLTHCGQDFIVMEFVPGATLDDIMKTGPLPTAEVIRLGTQMMQGLAAAHSAGVVHRDIKPGNLKITSAGDLKILDFGLATLTSESVSASTSADTGIFEIVGTAPYMAPERLRGEPSDERADIFGAGAVLYEMATGQRAFCQQSLPHLITAILLESPPSPTSVHPLVPKALSRVIRKMLEKEPEKRYSSASAVVEELKALRRTQEPRSRALSSSGRTSSRRRAMATVIEDEPSARPRLQVVR